MNKRTLGSVGLAIAIMLLLIASLTQPVVSDIPWIFWNNGGDTFYSAWLIRAIHMLSPTRGYMVGDDGTAGTLARWDGTRWTNLSPNLPAGLVKIYSVFFINPSRGWIAGAADVDADTVVDDGFVCRSDDGGDTWPVGNCATFKDDVIFGVMFADASIGYAVGGTLGTDGKVFKTTNAGSTWPTQLSVTDGRAFLAVHLTDASHVWAVGEDGLNRRTTDGTSWTTSDGTLPAPVNDNDIKDVFFFDSLKGIAVGVADTDPSALLVQTSDGGASWSQASGIPGMDLNSIDCQSPSDCWAVGEDSTMLKGGFGLTWSDESARSPLIGLSPVPDLLSIDLYVEPGGFTGGFGGDDSGDLLRLIGFPHTSFSTVTFTSSTTVTQTSTVFSPTVTVTATTTTTTPVTATTTVATTVTTVPVTATSTASTTTTTTTLMTITTSVTSTTVHATATTTTTITLTETSTTTAIVTTPVVIGPFPLCPIAAAIAGSELEGAGNALRAFRNNQVMNTCAGSSFMAAFNAWYYSWAPYVASLISGSYFLRAALRVTLYPLMGILYGAAYAYGAMEPISPELAAVVAGLIASSLIGLVYFALPLLIILKYASIRLNRKLQVRSPSKALGLWWLGSAIALAGSSIFAPACANAIPMMANTSSLVLSTLAYSTFKGLQGFQVGLPVVADELSAWLKDATSFVEDIVKRA